MLLHSSSLQHLLLKKGSRGPGQHLCGCVPSCFSAAVMGLEASLVSQRCWGNPAPSSSLAWSRCLPLPSSFAGRAITSPRRQGWRSSSSKRLRAGSEHMRGQIAPPRLPLVTRFPRASASRWTVLGWGDGGGNLGIYWLSFAASKRARKGKRERVISCRRCSATCDGG